MDIVNLGYFRSDQYGHNIGHIDGISYPSIIQSIYLGLDGESVDHIYLGKPGKDFSFSGMFNFI